MIGLYVPAVAVHQSIRISRIVNPAATDEEELQYFLFVSVFMAKVFQACKDEGVTHRSATGDEVHMPSIMEQTERELGMYVSPLEIEMMNRWKRYETEWEIARRRRYCYNILLRITSGGIIDR